MRVAAVAISLVEVVVRDDRAWAPLLIGVTVVVAACLLWRRTNPLAAVAVRVTTVPLAYNAEQVPLPLVPLMVQLIPLGLDTMVPVPVPPRIIVSLYVVARVAVRGVPPRPPSRR